MVDKHTDGGFGRDGISGMVSRDRAMRAREVAKPSPEIMAAVETALPRLLARLSGGPRPRRR